MQMPDHSLYLDNHCSQSVEIVQAMLYICLTIVFIGIIVVHDKLKLGWLCCTYARSWSLLR